VKSVKSVKSGLRFLGLAAALIPTFVSAGDADFTLVNRTGYTLREIYLSPTTRESWGRDRMGDEVLENGKARLFKFSDKASCNQDLKVVFDDDASTVVWKDIDLCSLEKITIRYNRRTGETTAVID